MGISTLVPATIPEQEHIITWPAMNPAVVGSGSVREGMDRLGWGNPFGEVTIFQTAVGAMAMHPNVTSPGVRCNSLAVAGQLWVANEYGGLPLYRTAADAQINADYQGLDMFRVFRVVVQMAATGADPDALTGFAFASSFPAWLDTTLNGFGITGDGAGGWQYQMSNGPGGGETIAIGAQFITDLALFNRFDFQIVNATPTSDAEMTLVINGQDFLTRTWTPLSTGELPDYEAAGDAFWTFAWRRGGGAPAQNLFIAPFTISYGKFTRDGTEQSGA